MKKLILLFLVTFTVVGSAYADDDLWITLGYNYYAPQDSQAKAPSMGGPANLTIGAQVHDWVALDFSIGYLWNYTPKENNTDISSMPIRLDLLVQPKFDTSMFDIMPYIGIGPQIAANHTNFKNNIFSYGFSAKAGVRFVENGVMFGIGAEYLYNPMEFSVGGVNYKYDTSGFAIGGEVGIAF